MGYTVYYSQKRPFTNLEWQRITDNVRDMFNRLKQVKGGSGEGRPLIDNTDIIFNGDGSKGEDHETFQLMKAGDGFQFCKTARKPYDRYVKAMLVVANFYAPGALEVTCDGDNEPDCWTEGVRIATIYTKPLNGRVPCSPLEIVKRNAAMTESAIAASIDFQEYAKSTDISHSDPYKGVYTELDDAIELLAKIGKGNKVHTFLANYLAANIDDIKDTWTP